jgi:deaminated glutathione amidase
MSERFTAAAVQMRSGQTPELNVEQASALIRQAAASGANYVQTPEMTNLVVTGRNNLMPRIHDEAADPSLLAFRALARELGIVLHIGSIALASGDGRAVNRAFIIGRGGEIVARYDKIHMFDVDLPNGESWRESASYCPGDKAVLVDLPWLKLGVSICYDLRFPDLYHALAQAGAGLLAVPAAFTRQTGEAHWHVLLRARAIETGCFVVAAAQGGKHEDGRETFGHSLIIDPWGRVLADAGNAEPGIVLAEIDPAEVAKARQRIPALAHACAFTAPEQEAARKVA